jgi:pyruvate ferredoxin oxidoreductase alpha subunit
MSKRVGMEIALAAAEAVALCKPDVVAAYPITPNTHVPEHLSDIVAEGRLDADFICVESEHSALSACCGASGAGARAFTATSSQGLLYMAEIVPIVPAMRLPIVMIIGNRAVSGPINIWNDHSDIMSQRDAGWISMFAANGQEVIDMAIQSFKIAEHRDVMLPVNLNLDGFQLTHVVEPMDFPDQAEVDAFLPSYKPYAAVHPDNIVSMGTLALPEIFNEVMKVKDEVLKNSKKVIVEIWKEWEQKFGRSYKPIETYKAKGAEILLLAIGSMAETAEVAVDEMRKKKVSAGVLKLRLWRPFPFEELRRAVKDAKVVVVLDRAVSFGGPGGPVFSEVRSALYNEAKRPVIINEIIGLGGRDIPVSDFVTIIEKAAKAIKETPKEEYEIFGVRGS